MAFSLTKLAKIRKDQVGVNPQLVLEIDGFDTRFGVGIIKKYIKVGDPDLYVDGSWFIGGFRALENQIDAISLDGTSNTIKQQLLQDKGGTSSVSTIQISLIDVNEQITKLITPGGSLDEILAQKARVYLGFEETAFPEDFNIIFQGIIDNVDASGKIVLNIAHPEQKKRQELFPQIQTELSAGINNSQTTITLGTVGNIVAPNADPMIESYVRIGDELIQFTGINTGTRQLTGCTRGALGTTAASHSINADVTTFYRIKGPTIDIALKLMLSGGQEYWGNKQATNIVRTTGSTDVANSIFFQDLDVEAVYGITGGDFISITDSLIPSNNVTDALIVDSVSVEGGSYIIIDQPLTLEINTDAVATFKSKYNTLSTGLGMTGDEVDVKQFEYVKEFFSGSLPDYDYYAKDTIEMKKFLDEEILFPAACYTLPRKGRVSVGFNAPPVSVDAVPKLDSSNVTKPNNTKSQRSLNKNFYNSVLYAYNDDLLEDKNLSGELYVSGDSTSRIRIPGLKTMKIEAKGLRPGVDAAGIIRINSQRILDRYKFAAEKFSISVQYGDSFNIEVGDIVLFGDENLQIADTRSGTRSMQPRLFEVVDKSLNIKTGEVSIELLDTNFSLDGRYGVFSPSSVITHGTTTSLIISESFGIPASIREYDKWENYVGQKVLVHDEDYTFSEEVKFIGFSQSNRYQMLIEPLSIAPPAGYIVDIPNYITTGVRGDGDVYKNIHCFSNPSVDVVSGVSATEFNIDIGDAAKFIPGNIVLIRDLGWTLQSNEVKILTVAGTLVTVESSLGFTPSTGQFVELIGYTDAGAAYRYM
jgi:hypothetical protein